MKTLSVFPLFFNDQRHKHLERGYKVDLYNLIKASWVCVDHILPNWEKFEILRELSAQAQSQEVISRIMLNGFLVRNSTIILHPN